MSDDLRVRDVGEFGLIDRLRAVLPEHVRSGEPVRVGIGDDAAVWTPTPGQVSVITTDTLIEGTHFRLDWTDWRSLGHKMLAVNLSDVASMGARAVLATITLGLSGDERVADLEEMYRGVADLAGPFGVAIAGGDIVRTPGPMLLSVTAIGEASRPVLRSGAQPGDIVAVSGTLGASAAGMRLLEHPDLRARATTADLLVAAHLRPHPRLSLGEILADGGVTAAMDLSDGLLGDLPKILAASGVDAAIDGRAVPVAPSIRALFPSAWLEMALRGGEDFELLLTIPPDRFAAFVERAEGVGSTITAIGEITARAGDRSRIMMTDADGNRHDVDAGAFDHFGS